MQWIYIICFSLISAGLLALFGVRPGDFIDALFRSQRKAATLSDELNVLMGTPAKGFFNQDYELKQILKGTGRSDRYEAVKRLSLILFAVGAVLALLINNVYIVIPELFSFQCHLLLLSETHSAARPARDFAYTVLSIALPFLQKNLPVQSLYLPRP